MRRHIVALTVLGLTSVFASAGYAQIIVIDDDLNSDTSSSYTVVNGGFLGGGDGTLEWAFDYGTVIDPLTNLPIPPAPGTTDGSTIGVRISVNNTLGATEAYTIFHNNELVGTDDYTMTMDVWMAVWSPMNTGSTEHAQFGVGADNGVRNHLFQNDGGICCEYSGSGHFVALSGDGAESSDYRHWRDEATGPGSSAGPVPQFHPDYLSPDMGTNVTGANFVFFQNIANINAPIPGVIGRGWATIRIEVSRTEGRIRYYVRGYRDDTTGPTGSGEPPEFLQIIDSELFDGDGYVNFGLADLYSSVAGQPEEQFAIFDNLFVERLGPECPPDITGDGQVNVSDLLALLSAWGPCPGCPEDINGDGIVDVLDLLELLAAWGPC